MINSQILPGVFFPYKLTRELGNEKDLVYNLGYGEQNFLNYENMGNQRAFIYEQRDELIHFLKGIYFILVKYTSNNPKRIQDAFNIGGKKNILFTNELWDELWNIYKSRKQEN